MAVFDEVAAFGKNFKVNFGKIWRGKCLVEKNLEVWNLDKARDHLVSQTRQKGAAVRRFFAMLAPK